MTVPLERKIAFGIILTMVVPLRCVRLYTLCLLLLFSWE